MVLIMLLLLPPPPPPQSCHNICICLRYMDLQYWSPLVFVKDPVSGLELPRQLKWLDWFVIDMAGAA
jgi:hypothetical protein